MRRFVFSLVVFLFTAVFLPCLASACSFKVYCDGKQCVRSKSALYHVCLESTGADFRNDKKERETAVSGELDFVKDNRSTIAMLKEYVKKLSKK